MERPQTKQASAAGSLPLTFLVSHLHAAAVWRHHHHFYRNWSLRAGTCKPSVLHALLPAFANCPPKHSHKLIEEVARIAVQRQQDLPLVGRAEVPGARRGSLRWIWDWEYTALRPATTGAASWPVPTANGNARYPPVPNGTCSKMMGGGMGVGDGRNGSMWRSCADSSRQLEPKCTRCSWQLHGMLCPLHPCPAPTGPSLPIGAAQRSDGQAGSVGP